MKAALIAAAAAQLSIAGATPTLDQHPMIADVCPLRVAMPEPPWAAAALHD